MIRNDEENVVGEVKGRDSRGSEKRNRKMAV